MFLKRKYILHTESESDINQWHFSNAKILALVSVSLVVLSSFLVIGADYVSKILYDKRLKEFKSNYVSVVDNIDEIQSRLKELDQQILEIEEKDRAVRTYAGMTNVDKDIRKLGIGGVTILVSGNEFSNLNNIITLDDIIRFILSTIILVYFYKFNSSINRIYGIIFVVFYLIWIFYIFLN